MKPNPRVLIFLLLMALLSGCQSMGGKKTESPAAVPESSAAPTESASPTEQQTPEPIGVEQSATQPGDEPQEPTELVTPSGNQPIRGRLSSGEEVFSALRNGFSRPVCVDGPANESWRRRYAGSPRVFSNHLSQILPLLGYVTEEVRKRDLPTEFALIPIIESRYQPDARGAGGPSGLWQMINSTARNHGVTIKDGYDGRFSVIDSTDAALSYLEELDRIFKGDWRAMVMGYNAGEYRILGAFKRSGSRQVSGEQRLPRGLSHITYSYVDKLHALSCLIAEPKKHGLQLPNNVTFTPLREVEVGSNIGSLQAAFQPIHRVVFWSPARATRFAPLP
jgi:membrane-bound lytic murein transglycosylase D